MGPPTTHRRLIPEILNRYLDDVPGLETHALTRHNREDYLKRLEAFQRPMAIRHDEEAFAKAEELLFEMFQDNIWESRTAEEGVGMFVPDSSAGFCPLWKATTKKEWVGECYPEIYDTYVRELEEGSRYPIWKHSLKEEILPMEGNEVKKSRVFMFADCAFNLYEYCYTSHLDDLLIENCMNKNWFGGGLPTVGLHWDRLTRMFMKHPNDLEADASQYDASMTQAMIMVPFRLRMRLAKCPDEVEYPLRLIYSHYAHSVMLGVYGNIYLKNEGFNSGTRTTLSDNCLRTIFSYLYTCVRVYGKNTTLKEITDKNCVATCGDDLKASSKDLHLEAVIHCGKELGIKWNPPDNMPTSRADYSFISCTTMEYKGIYVPVTLSNRGLVSAAYSERPWDPAYNIMRYCGILLSNPFNERTRYYLTIYKDLTMEQYEGVEDVELERASNLFERCLKYGHNLYLKPSKTPRVILQGIVGFASKRINPQKEQESSMSTRRNRNNQGPARGPQPALTLNARYSPAPQPRSQPRQTRKSRPTYVSQERRQAPPAASKRGAMSAKWPNQVTSADMNKLIRTMQKMTTAAEGSNRAANKTATQANRTVDESRVAKIETVNGYAYDLRNTPECVRNYMQILSNPFLPVQGKWCSIAAAPTLVVPSQSYVRYDFKCNDDGEFAVVLNSFNCAKDVDGVSISPGTGSLGANLDSSGWGGLAPVQLLHTVGEMTPSGSYQQATRARVVAAGICVAPIGNAFNTQGQIYAYTTSGNDLTQKLAKTIITSDRNSPRSGTLLSKCYANVYVPASIEQQGWLNNQPSIPMTHPFDNSSQGYNMVLYGTGFTAQYPMHLEYAIYCEYADSTQYTQFAQRTESHPKAAAMINETVNAVKQNHVETEPKKGFFEKVVDGIGYVINKVIDIAPAALGAIAML